MSRGSTGTGFKRDLVLHVHASSGFAAVLVLLGISVDERLADLRDRDIGTGAAILQVFHMTFSGRIVRMKHRIRPPVEFQRQDAKALAQGKIERRGRLNPLILQKDVRVTMKDGFCSLWNYDEWEEFAYVDIFEGQLRIAVDPRYTDALSSLNLCEVPRLLSSRHNLICVQVDDLNNTVLQVLVKAFEEVGLTAG